MSRSSVSSHSVSSRENLRDLGLEPLSFGDFGSPSRKVRQLLSRQLSANYGESEPHKTANFSQFSPFRQNNNF